MGQGPVVFTIRRLGPEDTGALMVLRRRALELAPFAFESGPGDDRLADPLFVARMLEDPEQGVFGAVDRSLAGMIGVRREDHVKTAHRAYVWGLFVEPRARSLGLARGLVDAALGFAKSLAGITSVHLSVSSRAHEAAALYRSVGFAAWGAQPDAVRVNGETVSEIHMVVRVGPKTG